MVDFSKLVGKRPSVEATDPLKLFDSLDRKGSHTTLRPAQIEALAALRDRRTERDLVLKLATGVGKSTVGLLYLQSHMAGMKRPGVYLCPTRQLVLQVLDEASRLGLAAFEYPGKEAHPRPECLAGEAIIVCTYKKLFNGRTTFDRTDVNITPSAIVLDDAHAGLEEVREAFTLSCTKDDLTKPLMQIFDGACSTYAPAIWEEIQLGRYEPTLEIPYWLWAPQVPAVRALLAAHPDHAEVKFVWPYLRDILRWCRCVVSAAGVEIVPSVIPARMSRAYEAAPHRLFMSGTLADESVLVRELGCGAAAATNPIVAGANVGLGERMVLAPSLLDPRLDRTWVMKLAQSVAKQLRVVALCASEKRATDWASYGATVVIGDAVTDVVDKLRSGEIAFAALAQRYDGVDLPDDACRLLILDGLPLGQGIVDRHDSSHVHAYGGVRNRLVFRIEQGMGRAVRSPADYAVVILAGPELASFTAKTEVRDLMSADARAQLELAYRLAMLGKSEGGDAARTLIDMVRKSLTRDAGWKAFYDENVRQAVASPVRRVTATAIGLASAEQAAATSAMDGDTASACESLSKAIALYVKDDDLAKGPYVQQKANYLFESNPGQALETQKQAYNKNRSLLRPPDGVVVRPPTPGALRAPAALLRWYSEFAHPNGAIAAFQALRARLSFASSPNAFEGALEELGPFLGAEGSRPEKEYGTGAPDNALVWTDLSLVIEAKTGAQYHTIPKKDAEQLLHSMEWFKDAFPTRDRTAVMVVRTAKAGDGVFLPEGARILLPEHLDKLLDAIDGFLALLVTRTADAWSEKEIAALLTQTGIASDQIVGRYTVPWRQS